MGRIPTETDDTESLESFLGLPFFDINFGESISIRNIKLDMESDKSVEACGKFLQFIEKLQSLFGLDPVCRKYRYGIIRICSESLLVIFTNP